MALYIGGPESLQVMATLRSALGSLAALALAACASTPPSGGMTVTPVPCSTGPYTDCAGDVADYSEAYGSAYAYYPVLVPVIPILTPPAAPPPPVKPPPPPTPAPPPKIRPRPPVERPCPKGDKVCP